MNAIVFEPLHPGVEPPARATEGSAGSDLRAHLVARTVKCSDGARQWEQETAPDSKLVLPPGAMALVPLGFRARLPRGIEAQIRPRSGAAFKKGLHIANAPGTVDCDFPDEWMVPVRNGSVGPLTIEHGERIAQMVLSRYEVIPFEAGSVQATTSRQGGFGSTGA
ncbi:MAG TPA: dUTP diphosphatase [Gemmatimonadaceae bacterium]